MGDPLRVEATMFDAFAHSPVVLCLFAMAASALSGLLPASPAEPVVVGIAALLPRWLLFPMAMLVTLSAMSTKVLLYLGASGMNRAMPDRLRSRVDALAARLDGHGPRTRRAVITISAMTGLPSFYVVTLLCGSLRFPLREWLIAGTVGRALRITALVFLPTVIAAF